MGMLGGDSSVSGPLSCCHEKKKGRGIKSGEYIFFSIAPPRCSLLSTGLGDNRLPTVHIIYYCICTHLGRSVRVHIPCFVFPGHLASTGDFREHRGLPDSNSHDG